jgi:hypothetical protein
MKESHAKWVITGEVLQKAFLPAPAALIPQSCPDPGKGAELPALWCLSVIWLELSRGSKEHL